MDLTGGRLKILKIAKRTDKMKAMMDSMLAYWVLLLAVSLGGASMIYVFWLRDAMMM